MINVLGDLGDPVKDAAAFKPVLEGLIDRFLAGAKDLSETHKVTVTVTFAIEKKEQPPTT